MTKDKFCDLACREAELVKSVNSLDSSAQGKILGALDLAKKEHSGQFRAEGSSYVIHPIRVALILFEELNIKDPDLLSAALLHDVVEDGSVTIEEIESQFGSEIARIVKGATRLKPENETEEEKEKNKLKKIEEVAGSDEKIRLVKLSDILDNNRSHSYIPQDSSSFRKIPRWRKEFEQYLPIAAKTNKKLFELLRQLKSKE